MTILSLFAVTLLGLAPQGAGGPLVILSSLESDYCRPVVERFRSENPGIAVDLVELEGRIPLERIRGEAEAQKVVGSVWWGGDDVALATAAGEGLLQRTEPAWAAGIAPAFRDRDLLWHGQTLNPIAVVFRAGCKDLPARYEDLAGPRFRGRLLLRSPARNEPLRRFIGVMFQRSFDEDVAEALDWVAMLYGNRADDPLVDDAAVLARLASRPPEEGELALLPLAKAVTARDADSLKIDFVVLPKSPAYVEGIAMIANAPNAAAARAFVEFAGGSFASEMAAKRGRIAVEGARAARGGMAEAAAAADLGDRASLVRNLEAWMGRVEGRVTLGAAVLPEGDDPNSWILSIIDIAGTVTIVVVLFLLLRRGKLRAAPPETQDSEKGPPAP